MTFIHFEKLYAERFTINFGISLQVYFAESIENFMFILYI